MLESKAIKKSFIMSSPVESAYYKYDKNLWEYHHLKIVHNVHSICIVQEIITPSLSR